MDRHTVLIGNDHGGFDLAVRVLKHLKTRGIPAARVGSFTRRIVRYPYYAARVAGAVSRGEVDRGILICSTGIGMSMIANPSPVWRPRMVAMG